MKKSNKMTVSILDILVNAMTLKVLDIESNKSSSYK